MSENENLDKLEVQMDRLEAVTRAIRAELDEMTERRQTARETMAASNAARRGRLKERLTIITGESREIAGITKGIPCSVPKQERHLRSA